MGRELQKKKNKSSVPKVRQKPKSKKKILRDPIIAANWDKHATLVQNYRRLGLANKLRAPTGGVVVAPTPTHTSTALDLAHDGKLPTTLVPGEARIERDAAGRILRVLDDSTAPPAPAEKITPWTPLHDPLAHLDPASEEDPGEDWHGISPHAPAGHIPAATGTESRLVRELQDRVRLARTAERRVRRQSEREEEWCRGLVEAHGEDFEAMFWDKSRNVLQQSVGDIRRRVGRWIRARGGEAG